MSMRRLLGAAVRTFVVVLLERSARASPFIGSNHAPRLGRGRAFNDRGCVCGLVSRVCVAADDAHPGLRSPGMTGGNIAATAKYEFEFRTVETSNACRTPRHRRPLWHVRIAANEDIHRCHNITAFVPRRPDFPRHPPLSPTLIHAP